MSLLLQLRSELSQLLATIQANRPTERSLLDSLVANVIDRTGSKKKYTEWENVTRRDILRLTMNEAAALGDPTTPYYDDIVDLLDIALTLSEMDAADPSLPLLLLEDVFETQTIVSCMKIFSWLEKRSDRITVGMEPAKGKGPNLLRALNNLLRRISKTGSTMQFCGRILIFLSSVFPFGERSGVNLRGEYGPPWTSVDIPIPVVDGIAMEGVEATTDEVDAAVEETKPQMEPQPTQSDDEVAKKKAEFYNTFWNLQTYFARPQTFGQQTALPAFKESVEAVLAALIEATKKEKAMTGTGPKGGSGAAAGSKRKFSEMLDVPEDVGTQQNYFFAKYLTSPDLLEYELADSVFRRQVLVQLLILLRYLLLFTPREKSIYTSNPRNIAMHIFDFNLQNADETWAKELFNNVMDELRATAPSGQTFAETIEVILEREQNWVMWKNANCPPMDKTAQEARKIRARENESKEPGDLEREEEERWRETFKRMVPSTEIQQEMPPPYGNLELMDLWEMGVRGLDDLENPQEPGTLENLAKQIKAQEMRKEGMKKRLPGGRLQQPPPPAKTPSRPSTPSGPPAKEKDGDAMAVDGSAPAAAQALPSEGTGETLAKPTSLPKGASPAPPAGPSGVRPLMPWNITPQETIKVLRPFDLRKQCLAWLALRLALRQGHLEEFGKIGLADIGKLLEEIKKTEKAATERANAPQEPQVSTGSTMEVDDGKEAGVIPKNEDGASAPQPSAGDGDVSMMAE
ncbi:hypothetical protein M407DRAFT_22130 [Tulasnella calospora MUT 4182]|uniref:THO complex subunit 1 n=1 Tax=Tulasnella calospora MUT 4182 TaxID=1051891 RepID=A0A0C3M4U6_9AGAM|nr:hypothetical protein M407DRAFT_22130 [Tulasnella calospora MUT 4182]